MKNLKLPFSLHILFLATLFSLLLIPNEAFASTVLKEDKPVLHSVDYVIEEVENGKNITLTIQSKSNSPVNWLNMSLEGPTHNLYGGGGGTEFIEVSSGVWSYKRTDFISKYAPSGIYTYRDISVENEAELKSEVWEAISVYLQNSIDPQAPVIQSIDSTVVLTEQGTNITLKILAKSNSPVNWLNSSLEGPTHNLYGGGGGTDFEEISPGMWSYHNTDLISRFAPSGSYIYKNISVENEAELESELWKDITFDIVNSIEPQVPIIESINTHLEETTEGTEIIMTIIAKSNSPISWLNSSFEGPTKNLYGGGSGIYSEEIADGTWKYEKRDFISKYAPSGHYVYSGLSVGNEGELESSIWEDITIHLANNIVTILPQSGLFNESQTLILDSSKNGKIYYTLDGSEPTKDSQIYLEPIIIENTTSIRFFSIDSENQTTEKYTSLYIIDKTLPIVTISPKGNTFYDHQRIKLTSSEESTIYYTLDGSSPDENSPIYLEPIFIEASAVLQFIAIDPAGNRSMVYEEEFIIYPFISVQSLIINKTSNRLKLGETVTLQAIILPKNATNKNLSWKSSNPKVASVDVLGNVRSISEGNSIITVVSEDGEHSASYSLIVENPVPILPKAGSVKNTSFSLAIGIVLILSGSYLLRKKYQLQ